ncbi:MAG: VOC family protein [Flammeovirgaceae bacterium]
MSQKLPIPCHQIDHYTLIVPNAKQVADFHIHILGFKFMRIQLVNAGSAPKGKYDMLNYVLAWPNDAERVLVITEGLTKTSIFHRFMEKYGQGIHHIAFEVDHMDSTFNALQTAGIPMTSDQIMNDLLTGLKQVFLDNQHTGVFIELIERPDEASEPKAAQAGFFTHDNMAGLAQTMDQYIEQHQLAIQESGIEQYTPADNYYPQANLIEQVIPYRYEVGIHNLDASAQFFNEVLALDMVTRSDQAFLLQVQNQNKPDLSFKHYANPPFCALTYQVKSLSQTMAALDSSQISYKTEENSLYLDEQYAGYPLRLCEAPL